MYQIQVGRVRIPVMSAYTYLVFYRSVRQAVVLFINIVLRFVFVVPLVPCPLSVPPTHYLRWCTMFGKLPIMFTHTNALRSAF